MPSLRRRKALGGSRGDGRKQYPLLLLLLLPLLLLLLLQQAAAFTHSLGSRRSGDSCRERLVRTVSKAAGGSEEDMGLGRWKGVRPPSSPNGRWAGRRTAAVQAAACVLAPTGCRPG
mmetsp:Transcript_16197/g.48206  ORF Transcript_16197/g.48206 Transcript_16197/m.48206 type:complete len:117 (-) Transcript_16197:58-408(-)